MRIIAIYEKPEDGEVTEIPDDPSTSLTIDLEGSSLHISRSGYAGLAIELEGATRVYINPYPGQMPPGHEKLIAPRTEDGKPEV